MKKNRILFSRTFMAALILCGHVLFVPETLFAWDCVAGKWAGVSWGKNPAYDKKEVTLEVAEKDGKCVMKFACAANNMNEVWESKENKLLQRELDAKGKDLAKYGATLEVRNGVEGYYLDCKDGKCDAGGDARTFWKIATKKGNITCTYFGVDPAKYSDAKLKAEKRIEYIFKTK